MNNIVVVILGFREDIHHILANLMVKAREYKLRHIDLLLLGDGYTIRHMVNKLRDVLLNNVALGITIYMETDYEGAHKLIKEIISNKESFKRIVLIKGKTSWNDNPIVAELKGAFEGKIEVHR